MIIPKKLKIGGKVYDVEITDKLDLGNVNYSGEIHYSKLKIRICPAAKEKMQADFVHEMIHGIFAFLGYDQDEKQVEQIAEVLYSIFVDNPKMFIESKGKK